jgi:hypothetical protein
VSTAEVVPVGPGALVVPVAPLADIVEAVRQYEETAGAILRPGDWQRAADGRFVVRSGWRRLALAFGFTDELATRDVEYTEAGDIRRVTTVVRVVAPNGRASTGVGVCSLTEKCCDGPPDCRRRHAHCEPGCRARRHWTAPDHTISATSYTRALSRAIADLVAGAPPEDDDDGTGPFSGHDTYEPAARMRAPTPTPIEADPATGEVLGKVSSDEILDRMRALSNEDQAGLSAYLEHAGIPTPPRSPVQFRKVARWLEANDRDSR